MIYMAICDDNKTTIDFLVSKISDVFYENNIEFELKSFLSGKDFLISHKNKPFDVVFMDIIMPGTDGFEAAKQVRLMASNTYIIFITTESSLVYDSFDFQPFYFIPKEKPQVLEERLKYVVGKLIVNVSANEKVFVGGSGEAQRYISPNEILYIKSNVNQLIIYLSSGRTIRLRQKLSDFFETLNKYIFTRVHNRIVVNMRHIDTVDFANMEILLDNNETIEISRSYKQSFKESYIRYTRNFS